MLVPFNIILLGFNRWMFTHTMTSSVGSLFNSDEPFSVKKTTGGSLIGWMWMLMVTWELAGGISVLVWFSFSRMLISSSPKQSRHGVYTKLKEK